MGEDMESSPPKDTSCVTHFPEVPGVVGLTGQKAVMGQRGGDAVGTEFQLLGRKSSWDLFSHICSICSTAELYTEQC